MQSLKTSNASRNSYTRSLSWKRPSRSRHLIAGSISTTRRSKLWKTTLSKNFPTCVLIERDELVGLLASWEMEGRQMDRALYLQAWDGLNPHKGARIGRGSYFVPLLCLSLFGGIQPVKLIHYLRDPKTNLQHDGMMQRFLVSVFPDIMRDLKFVDQAENTAAKNKCFEILKKLATADYHQEFGAIFGGEFNKVPYFSFDDEAYERFKAWYLANQEKIGNKSEDPIMQEHLSKYPHLISALATIFHVVELADTDSKSTYIELRQLEKAIEWARYLESHARRIYALIKSADLSSAFILLDKLTDSKTNLGDWLQSGFYQRDLERKAWAGLTGPEGESLVKSALARLEECRWIRSKEIMPSKAGGRPTILYEINPAIVARRDAKS